MELADEWLSELLLILFLNLSNSEIFLSVIKVDINLCFSTACSCTKVSSSYHLCVECFSQLSFDSEVYTKSVTAADFVYISESNESCEK